MSSLKSPWMTKRQLLSGSIAASIAVAGGGAWLLTASPKNFIVSVVEDALPYIDFERGAVEKFADQYYRTVTDQRRGNIDKITKFYRVVGLTGVKKIMGKIEKYKIFRRTTVSTFLIGTDFFDPLRDPKLPVEYMGSDPCSLNPFAEFS